METSKTFGVGVSISDLIPVDLKTASAKMCRSISCRTYSCRDLNPAYATLCTSRTYFCRH